MSPPCPRLRPPRPRRTPELPDRKSQSQAQPGLWLRGERYSKEPARGELGTTKPADHGKPGPRRSRHRLLGGPSVPTPPPGATFPKTDTLLARARGGARGLPRRVPWRPCHPPQDQRAKGRPKTPAHGACCSPPPQRHTAHWGLSGDPGTVTRTKPPPRGETGCPPRALHFWNHPGNGRL